MEDLANPAEATNYLDVSLEEYQMDGDIPFFLKELRNVVEAQGGVAAIAKRAAMSPETLAKSSQVKKFRILTLLQLFSMRWSAGFQSNR